MLEWTQDGRWSTALAFLITCLLTICACAHPPSSQQERRPRERGGCHVQLNSPDRDRQYAACRARNARTIVFD